MHAWLEGCRLCDRSCDLNWWSRGHVGLGGLYRRGDGECRAVLSGDGGGGCRLSAGLGGVVLESCDLWGKEREGMGLRSGVR